MTKSEVSLAKILVEIAILRKDFLILINYIKANVKGEIRVFFMWILRVQWTLNSFRGSGKSLSTILDPFLAFVNRGHDIKS